MPMVASLVRWSDSTGTPRTEMFIHQLRLFPMKQPVTGSRSDARGLEYHERLRVGDQAQRVRIRGIVRR